MNPSMDLRYAVYVLQSETDGMLYAGFSANLTERLRDHAAGRVPSTAPRRPLRLIHTEHYAARSDALRREKYFKTTKGKRTLRLMLADNLAASNTQEAHY